MRSCLSEEAVFQIVGCAIEVLNTLGRGIAGKPYEKCIGRGVWAAKHPVHAVLARMEGSGARRAVRGLRRDLSTRAIEQSADHRRRRRVPEPVRGICGALAGGGGARPAPRAARGRSDDQRANLGGSRPVRSGSRVRQSSILSHHDSSKVGAGSDGLVARAAWGLGSAGHPAAGELERETGFEPATSCLGSKHSTD